MRSAIYYPHTEVRSRGVVETALLLWDELEYIVPGPDYKPKYHDPDIERAMKIVGKPHPPSDEERKQVHAAIEEFATSSLPDCFFRKNSGNDEDYEIWPQKLLPETWDLLRGLNIVEPSRTSPDLVATQPAGLTVMSLLADCCAGETRGRITDRGDAYTAVSQLFTSPGAEASAPSEALISLTVPVLDTFNIKFSNLLDMREREASGDGAIADLRHSYLAKVEGLAENLVKYPAPNDRSALRHQFITDAKTDLSNFKDELRLARQEALSTRDIIITAVAGTATIVAKAHGVSIPIPPDILTPTGVAATIGGVFNARTKYLKSRYDILKKHPFSFLYELQESGSVLARAGRAVRKAFRRDR